MLGGFDVAVLFAVMKGKYPFLFLLVNWWLWFLNVCLSLPLSRPRNVFFCKWCYKPVFLSLIFEVKIFAVFSFKTIPQTLLILNLGMLSISTLSFLVLVAYAQMSWFFFLSFKLALGRNRWCSFEGNKSLCLSIQLFDVHVTVTITMSPCHPYHLYITFKLLPFFLVEIFESYFEFYIFWLYKFFLFIDELSTFVFYYDFWYLYLYTFLFLQASNQA